jgi:putative ABC transport system permease protein
LTASQGSAWTDDGGKSWGHIIMGYTNSSLLPRVSEDHPEVESFVRIMHQPNFSNEAVNDGNRIVIGLEGAKNNTKIFKEEKVIYADTNLFSFFTIPLIYGKKSRVLSEANYVVLSESTARRYFGTSDPTGELLKLNNSITLKVSGVCKDLPDYSHLEFDLAISNLSRQNSWNTSLWASTTSYVKLRDNRFSDFEEKL